MFKFKSKITIVFLTIFLLSFASPVFAATIYFADASGNVGAYDDVTATATPVGDLSAFTISQVIGLAYDPTNDRLIILDRNRPAVYEMDPTTGITAFLFTPSQIFQGGAVKGNTLYGTDETAQTVVAYDLTTFAPVVLAGATSLPSHTHGVGINPATGQLVGNGATAFEINDDGSIGATLVATPGTEDIDVLGSDFLVSEGGVISLIDGTTGTSSVYITSAQITSAGVNSGSVFSVVVGSAALVGGLEAIPTLSQWGMFLLIVSLLAAGYSRRKNII